VDWQLGRAIKKMPFLTDDREVSATPLRVLVPKMHYRKGVPTNLYKISLPNDNLVLLIAATSDGYVQIPVRCPHRNTQLANTGTVDPGTNSLFCQTDAITYSLLDGSCIENLTSPQEDPGVLKTRRIERDGDYFNIYM